jgi:serine/threonine protein kinase/tetratricopeptide (TPR) repeat protein
VPLVFPSGDLWKRLEALFNGCLELPPEARSAFLDQSCGSNHELRKELEALLQDVEEPIDSLQLPVLEAAHELIRHSERSTLASGTRLDHYEIISLFAIGGMGQVYIAEDTTLKRRVALKVLPPEVTRNEHALRRFGREALAASALNHPNIVTIHECGQANGLRFIVSEFVEGSTLREKLANGRLELDTILDIAIQIASALDAAHFGGIIHRDIKPENLMIRRDGLLKVLDFGIAKLSRPHGFDLQIDGAQTSVTKPAMLIGTAAYMSPEQATGKKVDARTDLFSFGVVLYEITTGVSPFSADTTVAILERILTHSPDAVTQVNPGAPRKLEQIINKALEKDRNLRYQHASDMRSELQRLKRDTESVRLPAVSPGASNRLRRLWKVTVSVTLTAMLLVAIGYLYLHLHHTPKLTQKDTVVLADLTNTTGDPVFDDTLETALTVALRQSPFLNVLGNDKIAATLQLMARPTNIPLTPAVTRELCQRVGSKAYIAGSIASLGSQYVLELKAVNCQSGDVLVQEQVAATAKEKVLNALGDAASKLRGELGESLAAIQKFDVPLQEATTPSLEALKAYSLGAKVLPSAALPYQQHAIQLDPNFAMGYEAIGNSYLALGELGRANGYFANAFHLRDHASERERLMIAAQYYENVTGQIDKAAQTSEEAIQNYPREKEVYFILGNLYASWGQWEKANEVYQEGMRLASNTGRSGDLAQTVDLAQTLLALQQFDQARTAIQHTPKLGPVARMALYGLAFLTANPDGMAEQQQWFRDKPEENLGISLASDTEAYTGHLHKARELTKLCVNSAIRADSKETGAISQAIAAQREAAFGNAAAANQMAAEALKLAPASQGVEDEATIAFAMAGDTSRAESLAQHLNKRFPLDTQMQSLWLPAIRGQLALDRKNSAEALNDLQAAAPPNELGQISFGTNLSCLYPTYIRGEAYLVAGQGKQSAAEFQKILDHSGIVWNCWTGALARLGVARANALQARTSQGADADAARVRALAAYKDFLNLWKDADPDIPILKEARAEYAKLQ